MVYYKVLPHAIMGAEKSQDLQSASWRTRRTDGVVPVWELLGWRPKKSCFSLHGRKRPTFLLKAIGRRSFLLPTGRSALLFYSGLQLIERGPSTLGRAICFTQSTDLNANLIKKYLHMHAYNKVWPNIWASCGPVKLTHKIKENNNHNKKLSEWVPQKDGGGKRKNQ